MVGLKLNKSLLIPLTMLRKGPKPMVDNIMHGEGTWAAGQSKARNAAKSGEIQITLGLRQALFILRRAQI